MTTDPNWGMGLSPPPERPVGAACRAFEPATRLEVASIERKVHETIGPAVTSRRA
jgi:hypothetical protein